MWNIGNANYVILTTSVKQRSEKNNTPWVDWLIKYFSYQYYENSLELPGEKVLLTIKVTTQYYKVLCFLP